VCVREEARAREKRKKKSEQEEGEGERERNRGRARARARARASPCQERGKEQAGERYREHSGAGVGGHKGVRARERELRRSTLTFWFLRV